MNTLGLTPNLYQKRNPYLYEYFFHNVSIIFTYQTNNHFLSLEKKKKKMFQLILQIQFATNCSNSRDVNEALIIQISFESKPPMKGTPHLQNHNA